MRSSSKTLAQSLPHLSAAILKENKIRLQRADGMADMTSGNSSLGPQLSRARAADSHVAASL